MSYKYAKLSRSPQKVKKYKIVLYDADKKKVKTIHFGAENYENYTDHKDDRRKANYIQRHKAREDWTVPDTAGSAARWILWHKDTIEASWRDYLNRFNLAEI